MASECLYNSSLYTILLKTITTLAQANTLVFICYEPRIDREHLFFEMSSEYFDICEEIKTEINNHKSVLVCMKQKQKL